jgi:hypothetical protein
MIASPAISMSVENQNSQNNLATDAQIVTVGSVKELVGNNFPACVEDAAERR